jgi:hypothetical protein
MLWHLPASFLTLGSSDSEDFSPVPQHLRHRIRVWHFPTAEKTQYSPV